MTPRVARLLAVLSASTLLAATVLITAMQPAGAAVTGRPLGRITTALQHRDGSITVTGWAYNASHSYQSITGCLAVRRVCVRRIHADLPSRTLDLSRHIGGRHAFSANVRPQQPGVQLELHVYAGGLALLDARPVWSPGARIVRLARAFVGNTRYVEGGSTPSGGFDCSGYTAWVFSHAYVAGLPHNAEAQRHVSYMHRIPWYQARPGDLVFYFAGGAAYHVAIYAGHGMQYAAATPQDGIRYQAVWSSNVEYRTDWH